MKTLKTGFKNWIAESALVVGKVLNIDVRDSARERVPLFCKTLSTS